MCGLSETIATFAPVSAFTSVDLPTFGRPATATNPDFIPGRSHVSGSKSAAVYVAIVPSSRRNETSGMRHSCSHWRQPPHGEALMPIAAMSPGR